MMQPRSSAHWYVHYYLVIMHTLWLAEGDFCSEASFRHSSIKLRYKETLGYMSWVPRYHDWRSKVGKSGIFAGCPP